MRLPFTTVPVLIVVLTMIGLGSAHLLAIPSLTVDLRDARPDTAPVTDKPATTVLLVDGIKCVDTAATAISALAGLDGVLRCVAYASRSRLEVDFDPALTSPAAVREALEDPIFDEATGEFLFDLYTVVEIDGVPVSQ